MTGSLYLMAGLKFAMSSPLGLRDAISLLAICEQTIEVANWYVKERLGWADCRLWKVESTEKFMMVLWRALAYLEYRKAKEYSRKSLADVIRLHRNAHARAPSRRGLSPGVAGGQHS